MAEKNTKLTPFEKEQAEVAKQILEYKLGSEASIVAMIYKNPDLLRETSLDLNSFHHNVWKVYFEICRALIIDEKKVTLSEIDVGLYLERHPKLREKYDDYGGFQTIESAGAYIKEENFDGYVRDLRKWNTIAKLVKQGFPVKNRLSEFCDMSAEEIYQEYEGYINHIFSNIDHEIKSYNALEGLHELVDDLNAGDNIGLPICADLLNKEIGGLKRGNIYSLTAPSGCVDCDTEFFNGTEWKRIADYQESDKVLQYNENGVAELVFPIRYIKNKADYLWRFKTKYGLDQCLSDEHTVVYKSPTSGCGNEGRLNKIKFRELREKHESNKNGFCGRFYTTFDYSGDGIKLSDDEIRLMIATFADGSFFKDKYLDNPNYCRFHIKKKRKKERLINLAKSANCQYEIKQNAIEGYHDIYITVPFRAKSFPKEWYNCNKRQLQIIADEVMFWDGSYKENNRFSTKIKEDADFIQFVFSSLGYRATIATRNRVGQEYETCGKMYTRKSLEYSVSYTKRNLVGMTSNSNKTKIEKYRTLDGYEYCFTVPSHMLVLRRNDKIFITGNCGKSTILINYIMPSMLKHNERCCMFINEEDIKKVKKELLLYCCTNVLNHPIQKVQLRDGHFDKETLETLHKAADWLEEQDRNHNLIVIPLEHYTTDIVVKLIKKYKNLFDIDYFILDTFKESSDSKEEGYREMLKSSVKLYDLIKPASLNVCLVMSMQTSKSSLRNRHLTNLDIGQSKSVVDVFSVSLLCRRVEPDEYKGEKNELKCFRLEGKTKLPFLLEKEKYYMLFFIAKNRFGNTDAYSVVSEIDLSTNRFRDIGYCVVPDDWR